MKLTVQHVDGLRFLTTAGKHSVVVDAALEDGGGGSAMSAPQMFAAALGACICEFVANSCRLREIPLEHLSLELEYEELERPRRVGEVRASLHVEPEPPEDVKRRLIGVARHATLVNTLARPPEIAIQFAGEWSSMPIYEYRCRDCEETFEMLVRADTAIVCPHCGSSVLDKLLSAPIVLSGQTTRSAGHTCCGQEERCDAPPCSEGSACWRG